MSGGADDAGAGGTGVQQDDWMEILLGFHPRTLTKTPSAGVPAKGGPAAPTAKADTCDTPQASGTTLFFDFDSVELTDSDKMVLEERYDRPSPNRLRTTMTITVTMMPRIISV